MEYSKFEDVHLKDLRFFRIPFIFLKYINYPWLATG